MPSELLLNPMLERLPVYQPGRPIEEVAREVGLNPADILKVASNENPLGPSPLALAAMEKALPQLHLYPDGNAYYLKQKLAQKLGVEPENLILGNGSNEVIELLGHALIQPGTDVIVSQYAFAVYTIVNHLFGGNLIPVPARDYGHDLPAMLKAITPQTRVVFVANPNNPTGTLAPRAHVLRLVNEAPPNVLIAVDEAYLEYLESPTDLLSLVRRGEKSNLLLLRTFSKIYGLAGLRIGYGVGHPELIAALEKIREPFNVNTMAQVAALAALDDHEHIERSVHNNNVGLKYFEQALEEAKLKFVPSVGNFVLVQVRDGQRVFTELQKLGIIVRPMGGYQLPEWIRISISTPAENSRCMAALNKVLAP